MEESMSTTASSLFKLVECAEIRCAGKKKATLLCVRQKCNKSAQLCGDAECICHAQIHQGCSYYLLPSIIKKAQKKQQRIRVKFQQFIARGEQVYNRMLQMVSEQKERFLNKFENYHLNMEKYSTIFLDIIQGRSTTILTGDLVTKAIHELRDNNDLFYSEYDWKKIEKLWTQQKQIVLRKLKSITNKLFNLTSDCVLSSSIIKTVDQKSVLLSFLPKHVKSIKTLYRATEQNFQITKFSNQWCGIENTITLALTQANKIIGGFTPLKWKRTNAYEVDNSGQTFLFSLTNQQKYQNYTKKNTIYHSSAVDGPYFGTYDLEIVDKANTQGCYTKIGVHYKNENIIKDDQSSYTRFSGATNGHQILLKEWQVFQVIFEQQV